MKKTWIIGIISIVPGLGFIILGKILQGLAIFLAVGVLTIMGFLSSAENASTIFFSMSFIVWLSQLYYSILLAQHLSRLESGSILQRRPVNFAPLPAGASPKEKAENKARLAIMELLPPGRYVNIALEGQTSSLSLSSLLYDGPLDNRTIYFGISDQDLLIVKTDKLSNPEELVQIPLDKIRSFTSGESFLFDIVDFDLGENKPLRIQVARKFRPEKEQLIDILSGKSAPGEPGDYRTQLLSTSASPSVLGQGNNLDKGSQKPNKKNFTPLFRYAGVSWLFFTVGYALSFAITGTWLRVSEVISTDVNIITHLVCFGPAMILTAFLIARLIIFIQKRFDLPTPSAQRINLLASVIMGFIAYIPAQFILLMGAAL